MSLGVSTYRDLGHVDPKAEATFHIRFAPTAGAPGNHLTHPSCIPRAVATFLADDCSIHNYPDFLTFPSPVCPKEIQLILREI